MSGTVVAVGLVALLATVACTASPRLICWGDSITRGVRPGVTEAQTYVQLLQSRFTAAGQQVEIVNAGLGGERTDMALRRLDTDIIAAGPRLVTIMYGTNDAAVDEGAAQSRLPLSAYEANLREMVHRLRAAGITPVLMTPIPLGHKFAYLAWSPYREQGPNYAMRPYVTAVRRVAAAERVPLVDHFAHWEALALKGTDLDDLMTDGCHPNPAGHEAIAETLWPVLQGLIQ